MENADLETPTQGQAPKLVSYLNMGIFVLLLLMGGVLSFVLPKQNTSQIERRKLAGLPHFSIASLKEGDFMDSLDMYYADNFPRRDGFVGFSKSLKAQFGYKDEDVEIYNIAQTTPLPKKKIHTAKKDSLKSPDGSAKSENTEEDDSLVNDAEIVKAVVIYKGRAIQQFGGSRAIAAKYAAMINKYHKRLGDSVKLYCLTIPTANDFYLPGKFRNQTLKEKLNITYMYSKLDSGIGRVDAYGEIAPHKEEYLYFNTDHHWTGRAAYYAYRAFCGTAGFQPYELNQLESRFKKGFLGSLYSLTQDKRLKESGDSVEYFRLPVKSKTLIYQKEDLHGSIPGSLIVEYARGVYSYSVFLGGDYPLMHAETEVKNGRKVLIIKDSYGNALAPFFSLHFQELYIIDYRSFDRNLPNFIKKHGITDVVFMHNTFVANASYTVLRESVLLDKKDPKEEKPVVRKKKKEDAGG